MWNVETFSYIENQCGGLGETGNNTKNFLNLSEARIQVNASIASSIPPVLQVKINADWYPGIITPVFTPIGHPKSDEQFKARESEYPQHNLNDNSSIVRGLTELILGEKMEIHSDKFAPSV